VLGDEKYPHTSQRIRRFWIEAFHCKHPNLGVRGLNILQPKAQPIDIPYNMEARIFTQFMLYATLTGDKRGPDTGS
jgi:hypothetical protein